MAHIVPYLVATIFIGLVGFVLRAARRSPYHVEPARYDLAYSQVADSQVSRIMLSASRRFSSLPSIHASRTSPIYRTLERKLVASGGAFGDSVEIFLGVQITCALISASIFVILLLTMPGLLFFIAAMLFAVALLAYPYDQVRRHVLERSEAVSSQLPDFAELLLMPISQGMGIVPALRFTTDRSKGFVAEEINAMLLMLESQTLEDARMPFTLAGSRLGTPEAISFCNALMMAYIESTEVAKNISAQAKSLRMSQFQKARALSKKLPVKLVLLFTVNLLPMLFTVILIPVAVGFSHSLGG